MIKGKMLKLVWKAGVLVWAALLCWNCSRPSGAPQPASDDSKTSAAPTTATATDTLCYIVGTGDVLPGLNYPEHAPRLPYDDGSHIFDSVRDILQRADIAFCNLETVLLDTGGTPKKAPTSGWPCYWFRTPERYVNHLIDAGYDFVSVANNHQMDFGWEGRERTLQVLDSVGLACAGALTHRSAIIERNGVKYGFCAFSTNLGCVSMTDLKGVKRINTELKPQCDVVIVSVHAGNEGVDYRHVPFEGEYGLPEPLGDVHHFAHLCVDAGADVVFGHGPHVSRAVELYKDRLIAYSLGNFCTPYGMNLGSSCGVAPMLEVCVDRSGNFVSAQIHPVVQSWGKGPRIDPQRRAIREIKELTEEDFPDTPLQIADDGKITKK